MENWIRRLYFCILEQEYKVSEIVMAPESGTAYPMSVMLPDDLTVQKWIDKLQDK